MVANCKCKCKVDMEDKMDVIENCRSQIRERGEALDAAGQVVSGELCCSEWRTQSALSPLIWTLMH